MVVVVIMRDLTTPLTTEVVKVLDLRELPGFLPVTIFRYFCFKDYRKIVIKLTGFLIELDY